MFVVAEPFEDPLKLSVEDRVAPNENEAFCAAWRSFILILPFITCAFSVFDVTVGTKTESVFQDKD